MNGVVFYVLFGLSLFLIGVFMAFIFFAIETTLESLGYKRFNLNLLLPEVESKLKILTRRYIRAKDSLQILKKNYPFGAWWELEVRLKDVESSYVFHLAFLNQIDRVGYLRGEFGNSLANHRDVRRVVTLMLLRPISKSIRLFDEIDQTLRDLDCDQDEEETEAADPRSLKAEEIQSPKVLETASLN